MKITNFNLHDGFDGGDVTFYIEGTFPAASNVTPTTAMEFIFGTHTAAKAAAPAEPTKEEAPKEEAAKEDGPKRGRPRGSKNRAAKTEAPAEAPAAEAPAAEEKPATRKRNRGAAKPAEAPAAEEATDNVANLITDSDLVTLASLAAGNITVMAVTEILGQFGVDNVAELPAERRQEFVDMVEKAVADAKAQ